MASVAWTYASFRSAIIHCDIDLRINTLEALFYHMENGRALDLSDDELRSLLDQVRRNVTEDLTTDPIQRSMLHAWGTRCVVALATRVPADLLDAWLPRIVEAAIAPTESYQAQLVSVTKEVLAALSGSAADRQTVAKNQLLPLLHQGIQVTHADTVHKALELLTELIADLGFLFAPGEVARVTEAVRAFTGAARREHFAQFANELPPLAVAWSRLAVSEADFEAVAAHLLAGVREVPAALPVLVALIRADASRFAGFLNTLIDLFYEQANALTSEEEDLGPGAIQEAQRALSALEALIDAFPAFFDTTVSYYTTLAFNLISHGTTIPESLSEGCAPEDLALDEDDGGDGEGDYGDETWKVRQAAQALARTLLTQYPDEFLATFLEWPSIGEALITDGDQGSRASGLRLLLLIADKYQSSLPEEVVTSWAGKLVNELLADSTDLVALVLPVLAAILKLFRKITTRHAGRALGLLVDRFVPKLVPDALYLESVLIDVLQDLGPYADAICRYLKLVLQRDAVVTLPQCLATISNLFARKPAPGPSLEELVGLVVKAAASSAPAVTALGVLLAVYGSESPHAKDALQAILTALSSTALARHACDAVTLVGALPHAALLQPVAAPLLASLQKDVGIVDSVLELHALWALLVGLSAKIFAPAQAVGVVGGLAVVVERGDTRSRTLAVRIGQLLGPGAASVLPKVQALAKGGLVAELVQPVADFLSAGNFDLAPLLADFIAAGTASAEPASIGNLPALVGLICKHTPQLTDTLVAKFDPKAPSTFLLRCVGELGARVSLAKHDALLDAIFALVDSPDRLLFTAAAEAAGLAAAGALDSVFPRLVAKATADPARLIVWLIALGRFLAYARDNKLAPGDLTPLTEFLLAQAEHGKETTDNFVACFAAAATVKTGFPQRLLEAVAARGPAAPVAARALAVWAETATEPELQATLPPLADLLDDRGFATNAGIILALRTGFRYRAVRQALAKTIAGVIARIRITPEQVQDIFYGAERCQIDVGLPMRTAAIDASQAFFTVEPSAVDVDALVNALAGALGDSQSSIQLRALAFLGRLCERAPGAIANTRSKLFDAVEKLEPLALGEKAADLEEQFFGFAVRYHVVVEGQRHPFDRLYVKYRQNPKLLKIETDASIAMQYARTGVRDLQEKSVAFKLLEGWNPDAAVIFAK
jgi:hypothetical protein